MPELTKAQDHLVFGLDIGTRSIVGSVGYIERNKFHVVAHCSREHETRSMIDGQIQDIGKVSASILKVKNELEEMIHRPLKEVCIAAAGRVLKTVTVHVDEDFSSEQQIDSEMIYSLDLLGIEKAYDDIREKETDTNIKYYCVGYTVVKYYLNDYEIINLEGHKARKIGADVLATFLPEEVVNGLYTAVEGAGLNVVNLTLEPIAAINVAIPQNYRLLNIALVDVGAGTSDISITKSGSIIAYGMIPHAGDEITESIVGQYLVDFNTAEKIKRSSNLKKQISFKDVMGLTQKISPADVQAVYEDTVDNMTKEIAMKIKELNGGKSVSAVFVVGGGGKVNGFTTKLAEHLELPSERVALRGEEVLLDVNFLQDDVKKDPLLVTPIGICLSFYDQKNNFIFVNINDERIKLYDNDRLTVVDAAMQIGFPNEALFPRRGKAVEYTVNGQKRMARGEVGEPAVITINGEVANINSRIAKNDRIYINESTTGKPGSISLGKLPEFGKDMEFIVNSMKIKCPRFVQVNDMLQSADYVIQDGDEIQILDYYTVEQLTKFLDISYDDNDIYVNNRLALKGDHVYENFNFDFKPVTKDDISESQEEMEGEDEEISGTEVMNSINDGNMNLYDRENANLVGEDNANPGEDRKANPDNIENMNSGGDGNKNVVGLENVTAGNTAKSNVNITVTVNGQTVVLKNKPNYIYVDILDFYPFDTRVVGGTDIVTTINGEKCDFTSGIKSGDVIEIYWRK